ncbi:MAG TPA: hypothetical protein VFO10_28975 [Oligoflexus sp.]|uniref:monooxygenase n=1 Tax=Oligoflexus sp. TaxID=1971216 RepID=UPI002D80950D|nr:hypothetical protein [Oligoflexus sp.]HET9241334.1 hypothetical protein [Oligoflexus sp.]
MKIRTRPFWILMLPLACSPQDKSPSAAPESSSSGVGLNSELTYYADIKPILESNCVNCHGAGGLAPFALDDATSATRMHRAIAASTQSRSMPPWMAAPGCQDYENDRSLSEADIAALAAWSQSGAKVGNPADYKAPPARASGLSRVDREMTPSEAYQPKAGTNDYRCLVLDWPETSTQFITGVGVIPGRPDIVHHVIAYRVPQEQLDAVKALDEAEAGPGYTCFGGPLGGGANLPQIASWAPGSLGRDLPAETGLKMEPGSKIVMQVHYNTEHGHSAPDQSKLLFKLDEKVSREAYVVPFTNPDWVRNHTMLIPAGHKGVKHSYSAPFTAYAAAATGGQLAPTAALRVYSTGLHMHLRGQTTRLEVERKSGGPSCLLDIPRWDFHWQGSYALKQTVSVMPGERMTLECTFDNPGAKDVNWGEGTEDEMCIGFVYVTL